MNETLVKALALLVMAAAVWYLGYSFRGEQSRRTRITTPGPFEGMTVVGAIYPADLGDNLRRAIANPGSYVGGRRGPSWPPGHPAHADVQETQAAWSTRAAMAVLGVDPATVGDQRPVVTADAPVLSDAPGGDR